MNKKIIFIFLLSTVITLKSAETSTSRLRSLAKTLAGLDVSDKELHQTHLQFSEIGVPEDAIRIELPGLGLHVYIQGDAQLTITPNTPYGPEPATPTDNVGRAYSIAKSNAQKLRNISDQLHDFAILCYFTQILNKTYDPRNLEKIAELARNHDRFVRDSCKNLLQRLDHNLIQEIKKSAEKRRAQRLEMLKKIFEEAELPLPESIFTK
ncbi:MAG: hypothetical protein K2X90_04345 [Candidatus Babeliaceae bacterium]|nr:hypothetical protein [Candidatus Babeliaceae bacterium]